MWLEVRDFPGDSQLRIWLPIQYQFSSVQFSRSVTSDPLQPHESQCTGSIPGQGRSHMLCGNQARVPQILSSHPTTCALQREKPPQWEAHTPQWRVAPLAATRESLHIAMKTEEQSKQIHEWIKKILI